MNRASPPHPHPSGTHLPFIILILVLLGIGLLTFRDYGFSWDEPLFYDYGKASQYAYSISARLDGTFDIEKSFGASASDHVTRGPAYLLIGGVVESMLEKAGFDLASAWHLTNFLAYLVGLTFFYLLSRTWLDSIVATTSTAFFALQPVFWNHAFINPKDSAFAIFFLITMYLGIRMVDKWDGNAKKITLSTILPGIILGITTAIRFLGPYAVLLIILYFISKKNNRITWWGFIPYGVIALITMVALWPFLWSNPINQFIYVLKAMTETSSNLKTLFMGTEYHGYELPRRYFPILLAITLTEPTWFLFLAGIVSAAFLGVKKRIDGAKLPTIFLWFGIILAALITINPPNSDGYRHYLFALPPVFLFAGFGINGIFKRLKASLLKYLFIAIILSPAIFNGIQLHPYEYTYYNSFVGGTENAFRKYEMDYWLTCYKEAMEEFNQEARPNARIYIKREAYIAAYYARYDISVFDYRTDFKSAQAGDFLLVNSRTNEDEKILKNAPIFLEIGREGAVFCVIKQIP